MKAITTIIEQLSFLRRWPIDYPARHASLHLSLIEHKSGKEWCQERRRTKSCKNSGGSIFGFSNQDRKIRIEVFDCRVPVEDELSEFMIWYRSNLNKGEIIPCTS